MPRRRAEINCIAASHGAGNVRVIGSARKGNELTLLVDMAEGRNLLDLVALNDELEAALGIKVGVWAEGILSPYLRDAILAEAVPL
jgi:uncharacterized protein